MRVNPTCRVLRYQVFPFPSLGQAGPHRSSNPSSSYRLITVSVAFVTFIKWRIKCWFTWRWNVNFPVLSLDLSWVLELFTLMKPATLRCFFFFSFFTYSQVYQDDGDNTAVLSHPTAIILSRKYCGFANKGDEGGERLSPTIMCLLVKSDTYWVFWCITTI